METELRIPLRCSDTVEPDANHFRMKHMDQCNAADLSNAYKARVTVIIVNYNCGAYLQRCLEALLRQTFTDFSAVVVDNASTDGSMSLCYEPDQRFFFLRLSANVGFAEANNIVGLRASSPWIATLNPDAIPADNWLEQLMLASSRHSDAAMFGSTQIQESDRSRLDGCGDVYSFTGMVWRGNHGRPLAAIPDEGEVFSPCAAAALYRTEVFQATGGFDKRFFCYCEDVDLGFRMRLLGHKCIQVKSAVVYHVGSETVGRRSDFNVYHGFRNRLWMYIKDMPFPLFQLLLLPHLITTLAHLIFETIYGRGKPARRGLKDALRGLGDVWALRRAIQRRNIASACSVAKAMCWAPMKILRRSHDVKSQRRKPLRSFTDTRS
jgi:N-acetylglucosaminyl-diphospho-decaprenol L-rhamnosyltransferase